MKKDKGTLAAMRNINRVNILDLIKNNNQISRAEIAKKLGMSKSAVSSIVDDLLKENLVREMSMGESTPKGGRRAINLHFVPDSKYALGIDIGAAKTTAIVTDLLGNIIFRKKFPSSKSNTSTLENISHELQTFLSDLDIDKSKIVGTGIGAPGTVDFHTGELLLAPGLQIKKVNLKQYFKDILPQPIFVDNDVNMAVIGEQWIGNARNLKNIILIAIGTGIGAGIILEGKIYRGARGFAGEVGHFLINPFTEENIGDLGQLELSASGKGVVKLASDLLDEYPDSILKDEEITTQKVFEAADKNDKLAQMVIQSVIQYLSFSISNVITLLNPDIVILGGGVIHSQPHLVSKISEKVSKLTPIASEIVPTKLGEDSAAFGAVAMTFIATENLRDL